MATVTGWQNFRFWNGGRSNDLPTKKQRMYVGTMGHIHGKK
jgi:hypothetical protein